LGIIWSSSKEYVIDRWSSESQDLSILGHRGKCSWWSLTLLLSKRDLGMEMLFSGRLLLEPWNKENHWINYVQEKTKNTLRLRNYQRIFAHTEMHHYLTSNRVRLTTCNIDNRFLQRPHSFGRFNGKLLTGKIEIFCFHFSLINGFDFCINWLPGKIHWIKKSFTDTTLESQVFKVDPKVSNKYFSHEN